ncbi:hypothetical protein B0H12DRAFT_468460 [Mycena haematopus]|nr:hypothetical protein B0H12DRAFT_468460 [Mycena haematopus]
MRIGRQVIDTNHKVDEILSLERNRSNPRTQSAMPSINMKDDLVRRLRKLSSSLEVSQLPELPAPLPDSPNQLVSNTHRPFSSDMERDMRKAFAILETCNTDSPDECARSLDDLSVTLMDVGLADQASKVSSLSVRIYADMGASDNNFAVALRNHSNHLRALDRIGEAVEPAQRAVEIYDRLPAVFDPGRAGAFDSLATCLYTLGEKEKALDASDKAVQVSRDLLRRKPHDDHLRADLALFLGNRANTLHALKYNDDALKDVSEAQDIYELHLGLRTGTALDQFGSSVSSGRLITEYAEFLGIHSQMLLELRGPTEALRPVRKAVAIWEQLAGENPDIFRPKLARGLLDLVDVLRRLDRSLDAKEVVDEIDKAVQIFRFLAGQSPKIFNPQYARSLRTKARVLMEQGSNEEALSCLNNALAVYTTLPERAWIQRDRNTCFTRLKRYSAAVEASRSAVEILKQVPTSQGTEKELTAARRDLAMALYNVSLELDASPDKPRTMKSYADISWLPAPFCRGSIAI